MFINDCLDFLRFAADTEGLLLRTRETVETETPLSLAISCMVIFFIRNVHLVSIFNYFKCSVLRGK